MNPCKDGPSRTDAMDCSPGHGPNLGKDRGVLAGQLGQWRVASASQPNVAAFMISRFPLLVLEL